MEGVVGLVYREGAGPVGCGWGAAAVRARVAYVAHDKPVFFKSDKKKRFRREKEEEKK